MRKWIGRALFALMIIGLPTTSLAKETTALGDLKEQKNINQEITDSMNIDVQRGFGIEKLQTEIPSFKSASGAQSFTLSDTMTAVLDENGVLTISGSGDMPTYTSYANTPWYNMRANIVKIVVGDGITSISDQAFATCYAVTEVSLGDSVERIGSGAFCECSKLKTISLPDSLKSIDSGAFADATALATIEFGKGLETIGTYAFQGTAITDLAIPEGVTKISDYVFFESAVKSVTIPKSATSVGCIGYGAKALSEITVQPGNTTVVAQDGILYSADMTTLISYPAGKANKTFTIPKTVTTLATGSFYYAVNLTSIYMGDHVKTIEDWVFCGSGLTSATIPDSVTALGYGPFDQCVNLVSAVIGAGIKETPYRMFQDCTNLETVTFKEGLEIIGMRCMMNCNKVKNVKLPSTVTSISGYAFYNCKNLTSINIPENVTYIGANAFYGCNNISYVIPERLTLMDDGSYRVVANLTISGTYHYEKAYEVLKLVNAERAAVGAKPLVMDKDLLDAAMLRSAETCIMFSHSRPNGQSYSSLSSKIRGENIAAGNNTAKSTMNQWMNSPGHKANILTSGYTSIGIGCFSQGGVCFWVQVFGTGTPEAVAQPKDTDVTKKIQIDATRDYELYFPHSNAKVGIGEEEKFKVGIINGGWSYVYAVLEPVDMGWSSNNTAIMTVKDDGTVRGVAKGVASLRFWLKENPSCSGSGQVSVFVNKDKKGNTINVDEEDGEKFVYNNAEYEITNIEKKTIAYVNNEKKSAKTISIPATVKVNGKSYKVTAIAEGAFKGNKKITTVKLGKNVTTIGKEAFMNCTKLKTVKMNSKVTTIEDAAFKNCKTLSSFTMPKTLKKIGKQAFYGCKKMKTLTIKTTKLTNSSVGKQAFKKTYAKMKIKAPKSKCKSYKTILRKKGISKKATIKKL